MKITKYTIQAIITMMSLCLFAQGSFAYAPASTHAGLTQETMSYLQEKEGAHFDGGWHDLVIQGSIDEDELSSARCLNHFYDPVHGVGFNDNRTSIDWATNDLSGNEFTWNMGIEAYAQGDEHTAMLVLGHVLHLVQDASVPDHTRNDPHKGNGFEGLYTGISPFEVWADKNKNLETLRGLGSSLAKSGTEISECMSIRECMQFLAVYSNGNFFSEDTIGVSQYVEPVATRNDGGYGYGNDRLSNKEVKLFTFMRNDLGIKIPALVDDPDYSVVSDYFDRLAPQVIPVGARVIDLFMTEAKFARADFIAKQKAEQARVVAEQVALNNKLSGAGFFGQLAFGLGDIFVSRPAVFLSHTGEAIAASGNGMLRSYTIAYGDTVYGGRMVLKSSSIVTDIAVDKTRDLAIDTAARGVSLAEDAAGRAAEEAARVRELLGRLEGAQRVLQLIADARTEASPAGNPTSGEVLGAATIKPDSPSALPVSASEPPRVRIILGVAQGSVPPPQIPLPPLTTTSEEVRSATTTDEEATTTPPDTVPPGAPVILYPSTTPHQSTTTSVHLSGTAEASSTVTLSWSEEATTYVLLFATTESGEWAYDIVLYDGSDKEGTTTLTLVAEDAAGNISDATTLDVVVTLPALETVLSETPIVPRTPAAGELVINEVAWAGTWADANDEWIELYNTTREELDLSDVILKTADGGLVLPLSGTLPSHSYFVLARSRADGAHAVSGPMHMLELPFGDGLDDTGEELQLIYATSSPEGTVTELMLDHLPYCADWCGKGGEGSSMERWRSDMPTEDYAGNWNTEIMEFDQGTDALGGEVGGTPGSRNGSSHLLSLGNTISADLVLGAEDGGYFINGNKITLAEGKTLSIEPGVVIKSSTEGTPLLNIRGMLYAKGTPAQPIVFTTATDDRFGGDLFADGAPSDADKMLRAGGIDLFGTSAGSLLSNVLFYNLKTGPYFDRTTATMTSVSIIDSNDGIELYKSTVNASDILLKNISGNDAIQVYKASTLNISSTTIINVGRSNDGIDIHTSTLVADDIRVDGVGGSILRLNNSTSTVLGVNAGSATDSVDIFVSGGKTAITDMVLSGGNGTGVTITGKGTLALASSTISGYSFAGIFVADGGDLTVSSSTLSGNGIGLRVIDGAVEIHDSTIAGNGTGIMNTDIDTAVDATENYWGDAGGPTLPGGPMEGDSVSENVLVDEFLVAPPMI